MDEALCFGWIDGIRKRVDESSYTIRFTPRKRGSIWSAANIKRVGELMEAERMDAAGLQAFAERDEKKMGQYSYENRPQQLDEAYAAKFRANPKAWAFFQSQPPSYRRTAIWWVVSAKQEETRLKRLATLMADSEAGQRIKLLRR